MEHKNILIGHGSGGRLSRELIREVFLTHFGNPTLNPLGDSAILNRMEYDLAYTTDSYVVDPIFFPGGNIGTLAVSGTVNDLAVAGAKPLYLSCGFIIEEGFDIGKLNIIVMTMAHEAKNAGVTIVTGDTKIVKRGQADKVFINTSGIGIILENRLHINKPENFAVGDKIIVSGSLGDHAIAILSARENLTLDTEIQSDAAPLNSLVDRVFEITDSIKGMRDITRGGLATVLVELCENQSFGIQITEKEIPVHETVQSVCELYGFDPLYLANEGKIAFVVKQNEADKILSTLQNHPLGKEARIIGETTAEYPGKVTMRSLIGGTRIVDMLNSEILPRIC